MLPIASAEVAIIEPSDKQTDIIDGLKTVWIRQSVKSRLDSRKIVEEESYNSVIRKALDKLDGIEKTATRKHKR